MWKTIDSAPKDGRFIDSFNCYNGERRVTRWEPSYNQMVGEEKWINWNGDWGNNPTHWTSLPMPPVNNPVDNGDN